MKKRVLSLLLALVVLLGLLPAGALAAEEADLEAWFNEEGRALEVCGVRVTATNAHNILESTDYSGTAEFDLMVRGSTIMPTLTLTDLDVVDEAEELSNVVEYTGSGQGQDAFGRCQNDILYIKVVNESTEESTFESATRNAVDIKVLNASLDISGGKLNLEGNAGPSNLSVRNGNLHIHDMILSAIGNNDGGIEVSNGTLTVSGADTQVTSTAGRFGAHPVFGLYSETPLELEDIFVLNDGLAITTPAGARAELVQEQDTYDGEAGEIPVYYHLVAIRDENGEDVDSDKLVIAQPHTHTVDEVDVTFDHTLACVDMGHPGDSLRYLLIDGKPWVDYSAQDPDDAIKINLPTGSYRLEPEENEYFTIDFIFDRNIEIDDGTVNLCLNGAELEFIDSSEGFRVEAGETLTLSDCDGSGSVLRDGQVIYVFGYSPNDANALGELLVESGAITSTQSANANRPGAAIESAGYVTLRGGEVSGPYGVGITYHDRGYVKSPLTLEGEPEITGSLADIHILYDDTKKTDLALIDASAYTGRELSIEFALNDGEIADYVGLPIVKLDDTPADKFTLTNEGYCLKEQTVDGKTCLVLAETTISATHSHPVCGESCTHGGEHDAVTWTAWDSETDLPTNAGNYYLTKDVALSSGWTAPEETTNLCLNGHTITIQRGTGTVFNGDLITVPAECILNICDCSEDTTGTINGGYTYNTLAVTGGTLSLYSGKVTGKNTGVKVSYRSYDNKDSFGGTFQMHGGSMEDIRGCGVDVGKNGVFLMTGGTISIGSCNYGGVYVDTEGTFRVQGNVNISGNLNSYDNTPYNVVMDGNLIGGADGRPSIVPVPMELSGPLGENAVIGLSPSCWQNVDDLSPYLAVQGYGSYTVTESDFNKFFSDDAENYPLAFDYGTISFKKTQVHTHAMSVDCSTTDGEQVPFTAWTETDCLPINEGNYFLTADVTLSDSWSVPHGITNLCLNGYTIRKADGTGSFYGLICISEGNNLNICDCSEHMSGTIDGGTAYETLYAFGSDSTLSLYGGRVTGGNAGVEMENGSTFRMYGGSVMGLSTGVGVGENGAFRMTGGAITGNNMGVLVDSESTFQAEGNVFIFDNTSYLDDPQNVVMYSKFDAGMTPDGVYEETIIPVPMGLSGALGEYAQIGLSLYSWSDVEERNPFTAVQGTNDYPNVTQEDFAKFSSDSADYPITLNEDTVYFTKPHTHTWATGWTSDADGHWHACTAEDCTITDYANCGETGAAYAAHVYDNAQDTTCNTCGYERAVPLSGTVTITGTAQIGQTLTATVTDAPGGITLEYAWTVQGGDGAVLSASQSYTPTTADVLGKTLVCIVTTQNPHYTGSIQAATQAVVKGGQAAPAGLFTVTDIPYGANTGSIAITGDADKLEWRKVTDPETETWTAVAESGSTAALSGLEAGSYQFRYQSTATHNASPSVTVQVRALTPEAKALTIDGNITHGTVTSQQTSVNPGDTVTLTVQPDQGYELTSITVRCGDGQTITPTVKADNAQQYTFTMPDADVTVTASFTAVVSEGETRGEVQVTPGTPAVSVDKDALKDLAGEVQAGNAVIVTLTVEKLDNPADRAELEAVIRGDRRGILYLDLSLLKQVNDQEPEIITDTGAKVLEIAVPYDFTGKRDVTVYRKHGSEPAQALTRSNRRSDGTYRLDETNGVVYIYATKFSTYAISYTSENTTPTPGGDSSPTYYTLTATAGEGGSIAPSGKISIRRHRDRTFAITPDEGYVVADVLVDGKSVGAVSAYTFERVTANHTITVSFQKAAERPAWNPFVDVRTGDWFYDSVKYVYEQSLMEHTDATHFSPDVDTSRAMIAAILWRLAGEPEAKTGLPYPDCEPDGWYTEAVAWGMENGVVMGYGNGDFGPEDPITREQLALMLYRYAKAEPAGDDLSAWADSSSVSVWARDAMAWAVEEGILTGKDGTRLDPAGKATRAEAAAMLMHFCKRYT